MVNDGRRMYSFGKVSTLFSFIAINAGICVLIFLFDRYPWYLAFISVGSLYKFILIVLIVATLPFRVFKKKQQIQQKMPVALVMPVYTEGHGHVTNTLQSLKHSCAKAAESIDPLIIVVVDGKAQGRGNTEPTNIIVQNALGSLGAETVVPMRTWSGKDIMVECHKGTWEGMRYVLFVKGSNVGKKDSLILVRDVVNHHRKNACETPLDIWFSNTMEAFGFTKFDAIIGTDCGTRFEGQTVLELVNEIHNDPSTLGVSGFIKPDPRVGKWYNPLYFYQAAEYIFQQGLTRSGQSVLGKVTCLPGCVQILRVDDKTLGEPMEEFRKPPSPDSLFQCIRAFLGEDRRYTDLVLFCNKSGKTTLNCRAYAYTDVPDTWKVFLSQRRRWFLSSQANNITEVFKSSLPLLIRFISAAQLWNAFFAPTSLVCVARLYWLIYENNNLLLLVAFSTYIFFTVFKVSLLFGHTKSVPEFFYTFFSMLTYTIFAPFINMFISVYAVLTADDFSWGLTQQSTTSHAQALPEQPTTFALAPLQEGVATQPEPDQKAINSYPLDTVSD